MDLPAWALTSWMNESRALIALASLPASTYAWAALSLAIRLFEMPDFSISPDVVSWVTRAFRLDVADLTVNVTLSVASFHAMSTA